MTTQHFQKIKLPGLLHAIQLVLRWYVIFSVQTAIIFVLARLGQNMVYLVIVNSKLASAVGFIAAGVSGITQFITIQPRRASTLVAWFFECLLYALVFFMSMFVQTIVKGFYL